MPRVDINGAVVDFPDNLSGDELNKAVASAAAQLGSPQAQPQKTLAEIGSSAISNIGRDFGRGL